MDYSQILFFVIFCINGIHASFNLNYSLYELTAYNERDRALLYHFHIKEQPMIFVNLITNQAAIPIKLFVRNSYIPHFEEKMKDTNIEYILDQDYLKFYKKPIFKDTMDPTKNFLSYDNIVKWVQNKLKYHPGLIEEKIVLKRTAEKRKIPLIKVSTQWKPHCIYLIGGESARDWMSVAVILNFVEKLINIYESRQEKSSRNPEATNTRFQAAPVWSIIDFYDIYVIPVSNPDGYVYSMENDNRFWMRNRQTFYPKKICYNGRDAIGVNIDRNWHLEKNVGSESECSGLFLGHTSLSEQETSGIFTRINKNAIKLMGVINVRSFNRMLTIPYSTSEQTINHDLMMEILPAISAKMQETYNETFYYGTTSTLIYNFTSNMADYVKSRLNIPIVMTIYLQHQDNLLPSHENIPLLTDQLFTILNETLYLSKDIYGPLYKRQSKCSICMTNFIIASLISFQFCLWAVL